MKLVIKVFIFFFVLTISAQNKATYTYSIKGKDTLKLDVYTPENIKKTDTLPVLLWMHGGGFSGGHREYIDDENLVKYAAKEQNYIGISISYRLLRKGTKTGFGCDCTKDEKLETFKQAAIDYMDAAKYVVEHANELQIDTTKIIAGGSSAGAEGILNAVFMREYFVDNAEAYSNVKFAGAFSCAGAIVDASYMTPENAVPTVLYHGTKDQLVPYGNAPHHYCAPTKDGYIMLDGSKIIADKLEEFETSFYFNIVKEARHEISRIPYEELDIVFNFFERTVINDEIIQTKIIKNEKVMRYISFILISLLMLQSCKENKSEAVNTDVAENSKRPNIIYIMADDHAAQAISAYGHPIGQLAPTPNIDRLAKNGAIFKNNFCTNSICGPSRAVVLTGKHSHINGFRMNGDRFDGSQQTLPKLLKESGYNTAIVGKWHLHGYPEGFDHWNILNDQGNYYNPQFIKIQDTVHINKKHIDTTAHWTTKLPDTTVVKGYATDLITDYAIDYIDEKKNSDQPFFLMVHHKAPHRNWMPALRHVNKYDSVQFPLPDTYFTKHENSTASKEQLQTIYRDMYEGHDLKMTKEKGSPELAWNPWKTDFERMTPEQRAAWDKAYQPKNDAFHDANLSGKALAEWKGQRYLQEYLSTIASVDEGIGKILDYLDANGLTENTIVVYTSDQGFYLGEKGWFDKRFMYEESLKMPLLIQYPEKIKPGTVVEGLTQNLDFAETFLDFADVDIPNDMQGKSFAGLLDGTENDEDFRDAVYYHYYDYPAFHMVKKMYGVRTNRYKLIHVYDDIDEWELYDLQTDPKELTNLIDDKNYDEIETKLRTRLAELQEQYKVTEKEFEKALKQRVDNAYKQFERLRGNTGSKYHHH